MAWEKGGSIRSCDALLKRVEDNDPKLTELVILPMKTFGMADMERLSNAIASGGNTNLQSISASGHRLPPDSLKQFGLALSTQAKALLQNKENTPSGITSVAIGSKDMGDEGMIAFCEGLEESNGGLLQCLDFGWKNLGKEGVQAIGRTFATSKYLTHIDLSRNNAIGSEGIKCIANAAKEKSENGTVAFPSLEKMILSECNIDSTGVQSLTDIIIGADNNRSKPIYLAISSNPLGSEGCGELSKLCAIPGKGSMISHLHLSQCSIGDEGIKLLSSAAISNSCIGLTVLDLSGNSITKDGVKVFAESLGESWPDLVELKMAKNELEGDGVTSMMGALIARRDGTTDEPAGKKNTTLQNLDLSCTNCGIEGAKAALMGGGLSTLRMFNNRLGSDGFNSLSSLLQGGHPSIENLDLGGNDAGEEAVVALLNAIADTQEGEASSKLSVLEIGGNKFGEEAMVALNELKQVWPLLDVAHDNPVEDA
eukprot:CAMPEP_0201916646 /NCGR_PEP_ID=MMETSP0903-20130614/6234_1 /ASSEMBLY_ACC=CAM_ASM_000552 /TAXON_ID=420261 /ORGANISM="Thalassiosira antarctica, Strain CCMP982" /LENGTH=481 /DNA_ID=CAMNT_0048452521 /DNA_START=47 /DNA_END=1489 /DNA_ORIENTATION=+